ncbi:MAG: NADH-quinone oxidoreductase subunit N [Betaproteobacteria bacterium]|nr:MAG: NADH-quinone oxidoreductase subunit N [Betaproteobacteria bacterium]
MNWAEVVTAMLPEHLLLAGIVVLILVEVFMPKPRGALGIALLAVIAAMAAAASLGFGGYEAAPFAGQFSVDPAGLLAKAVVLGLTVPVLLLSRDDFEDSRFHLLLLSSLYGTLLLLSADSFLTLFLGLELMSLPVYALVLLAFRRDDSAEAALKYLVLGGAATATFLMGVALLFGATGSLALPAFVEALAAGDTLSTAAVVLIVVAFFLKAAIVPFHAWAPDAYEGASVPVTAYMATIIKAGVLLAVARLFGAADIPRGMVELLALLPLASMVWGNLAAIRQTSFRRMIAYSSIAHAGYLYFAFLGAGEGRFQAIVFYLLVYGLMNLLAFAALPRGRDDAAGDAAADELASLKGLFQRAPWAALVLAAAMLSLAGIPPLPGFVAKFLIFRNVIEAGYTLYAIVGLVASYLGIYFYLRVIQYAFMSEAAAARAATTRALAASAALVCAAPAFFVAVLPGWVLGKF